MTFKVLPQLGGVSILLGATFFDGIYYIILHCNEQQSNFNIFIRFCQLDTFRHPSILICRKDREKTHF